MKKFENIVVLAAGKSTRFWPLAKKSFFTFCGRPLIAHRIAKLVPFAKEIHIVTRAEDVSAMKKAFHSYKSVKIIPQQGRGFAAAYMSAAAQVSGEALVVNVIDLFDEATLLTSMLAERNRRDAIITSKKMKDYFPGGYLRLEGDRVVEIVEKPLVDKRPSDKVRIVVDYFRDFGEFAGLLSKKSDDVKDGLLEEVLSAYLREKNSSYIDYTGPFCSLKYPWDVLSASEYFLSRLDSYIDPTVTIPESTTIDGRVYIERGARVMEYAKVVGPSYIGENTLIGNYALVYKSMVGRDCLVGGYTELMRSWVGDKVYLHRNYVGDSVVDSGTSFGAGTVTANWRFDEGEVETPVDGKFHSTLRTKFGAVIGADVKLGVNASTMPGVKIAPRRVIHPNQVVKKDVG